MIGKIVHFLPGTLNGAPAKPYRYRSCIPAIVIRRWAGDTVQLAVFPDGSNDLALEGVPNPLPIRWETSVLRVAEDAHFGERQVVTSASWHPLEDCE